jgi:soluble lytic murein transglycosylase-like protein
LATSDFGGWKVSGLDTAQAILQRKGAAGLTQFIWPTGKSLGAISVNTQQAAVDTFASDVYNPKWSLQACCKYMKSNEILMRTTRNPKSRRKLIANKIFSELCATAGYNTGPGKIRRLLNLSSEWKYIRLKILEEPRLYSEKIIRIAEEMKKANRWKQIPSKY